MGNIEVNQWFASSKDIDEGIALFEKYSKNKTLIKVFKKNGERSRAKLEYELSKYVDKEKVIVQWIDSPKKRNPIIDFFKKIAERICKK